METNHCMNCGAEQGLVGKQDFHCERCGAMNRVDGCTEIPQDREQMNENIDFYDNRAGYRDREDYLRSKR